MKRLTAFTLLAGALSVAHAGGIYRCGPDGRTYSQSPCADGRLIDAADPRSEAERAEAKRIAAKERTTAAELERDRRARELAREPSVAAGFVNRPAVQEVPSVASKPKRRAKKVKSESKDFVAVEPSKPK